MTQLSDQELLALYFKTDQVEYLGILFKRYTKILIGVSMKYTNDLHHAEDVVQQIFIKFLESARPDIQNVGGWLYFLTKNESINYSKSQSKHQRHQVIEEQWSLSDDSDHQLKEMLTREENATVLMKAVGELKEDQRVAIECFYLKNMSYDQVAEHNNWTVNEVKSHLQNGKRNLKIKLEGLIIK